jgi:hypothetical protein
MPIEIAVGPHVSGLLPFDFEHELCAPFLNIRRERINLERLFENLQGAFGETGSLQDHAHARERAKMARFRFHDTAIAPSMSPVSNLVVAR